MGTWVSDFQAETSPGKKKLLLYINCDIGPG